MQVWKSAVNSSYELVTMTWQRSHTQRFLKTQNGSGSKLKFQTLKNWREARIYAKEVEIKDT